MEGALARKSITININSVCSVSEDPKHHLLMVLPYRAKLCRAKFSSGETIRRAKFSSPVKKFVTFARQSFAR